MSIFQKEEFETKPREIVQDPNTGETVHRVDIHPKLLQEILDCINGHSACMNEFVHNSDVYFKIAERQIQLVSQIKKADQAIKDKLQDVTKRSKLDSKLPWIYNPQLRCYERRVSPTVAGMSKEEIARMQNPGMKPTIIDTPGVGIR